MLIIRLIQAISVVVTLVLPILGVSRSQGILNQEALKMIDEQPYAKSSIHKVFLLSSTIIETTVIITLVTSFLMIYIAPTNLYIACANLGIVFAIGVSGLFIGLASAAPAREAIISVAREPFEEPQVIKLILISLTLMQTPSILGFANTLIAFSYSTNASLAITLSLIASGLALGLGCIGPLYGMSNFAQEACSCVGINRSAFPKVFSFAFLSQTLIEAPILFAFIIALIACLSPTLSGFGSMSGYKALAGALAIILTTANAGFSSGRVARKACVQLIQHPELQAMITKLSLIGQVLIDTNVICGFIISMLILMYI